MIFPPHSAQNPSPIFFSRNFCLLCVNALIPKNIPIAMITAHTGAIKGVNPNMKRKLPASRIKSRFTNFNNTTQNKFDKKICQSSDRETVNYNHVQSLL